jgi:hypothetical protein
MNRGLKRYYGTGRRVYQSLNCRSYRNIGSIKGDVRKNLPGNREKCFFLTSPFIEPHGVGDPCEIKSLGHPPAGAATGLGDQSTCTGISDSRPSQRTKGREERGTPGVSDASEIKKNCANRRFGNAHLLRSAHKDGPTGVGVRCIGRQKSKAAGGGARSTRESFCILVILGTSSRE